jgi:ABC-type polysaccharide/polyol phosphate export permease
MIYTATIEAAFEGGKGFILLHPRTISDIRQAVFRSDLWRLLAFEDIRRRYRRSLIGPFWLTISTGLMVASMGVLYSAIMSVDITRYIPHFAIGLILWQFIATTLNESTTGFIESAPLSRQMPIPWSALLLRIVARNVYVLVHNVIIIVAVLAMFRIWGGWNILLVIPGLVLLMMTVVVMGMGLAIAGVRFRDIAPTVASLLQISFFMTPILWLPDMLPPRPIFRVLSDLNLFHHLVTIVRAPLMGEAPGIYPYAFVISMLGAGTAITLWAFDRVRSRIVFWC